MKNLKSIDIPNSPGVYKFLNSDKKFKFKKKDKKYILNFFKEYLIWISLFEK